MEGWWCIWIGMETLYTTHPALIDDEPHGDEKKQKEFYFPFIVIGIRAGAGVKYNMFGDPTARPNSRSQKCHKKKNIPYTSLECPPCNTEKTNAKQPSQNRMSPFPFYLLRYRSQRTRLKTINFLPFHVKLFWQREKGGLGLSVWRNFRANVWVVCTVRILTKRERPLLVDCSKKRFSNSNSLIDAFFQYAGMSLKFIYEIKLVNFEFWIRVTIRYHDRSHREVLHSRK